MSLGMLANVYTTVRRRCVQTDEGGAHTEVQVLAHVHTLTLTHRGGEEEGGAGFPAAAASHLGLPLLQQRLQPLLGRPPLVVVADDQDDVVPVELAHQVEPHVRLVGVRRHGAQEGQVDALRGGGAGNEKINTF